SVYDKLIREIEFMDDFREQHNYSFMTEDQMARSLLNTFYGKLNVQIEADKLLVQADLSEVPARVREYADTLGVKVELGDKYESRSLNSTSLFHYEDEKGYYIGLYDEVTELSFAEQSAADAFLQIEAVNSPVTVQ